MEYSDQEVKNPARESLHSRNYKSEPRDSIGKKKSLYSHSNRDSFDYKTLRLPAIDSAICEKIEKLRPSLTTNDKTSFLQATLSPSTRSVRDLAQTLTIFRHTRETSKPSVGTAYKFSEGNTRTVNASPTSTQGPFFRPQDTVTSDPRVNIWGGKIGKEPVGQSFEIMFK